MGQFWDSAVNNPQQRPIEQGAQALDLYSSQQLPIATRPDLKSLNRKVIPVRVRARAPRKTIV